MNRISMISLVLAMSAHLGCKAQNESVGTLTGALDDAAWASATWLSVVDAPVVRGTVNDGTRAADGANWFVSTLRNDKKVVKAIWMTTGLGTYDLYVNGRPVGQEVLKPGFTHPLKTRRSFTYDITRAISRKAGAENTLSVQVTPGWWADKIITPAGSQGMWGTKCAFRGVVELTFADGSVERYGTNTQDWKAGIAGPVKHAAIFDGEDYDAREKAGHDTPPLLKTPEQNREFQGEILPNNGAEIYQRPDLALSPTEVYVWKSVEGATDSEYGRVVIDRKYKSGEAIQLHPGETLVVDFGQNASAVPSFVFQAQAGTKLNCLPGELLNDGNGAKSRGMDGPGGSVHRLNLRIPHTGMILNYTFAEGNRPVAFTPRNTFFGYRFVSITADADVTIQRIQSVPVTSIARDMETGVITTGHDLVNRLIQNTIWGQRSNYLSVPTDCPQRNERLGWMADTQVFTETATYFANVDRFFHKWLRDVRDTQDGVGAYPGVSPLAQYGAGAGSDYMRLGWADAGVICPWTIWKQYGDRSIIDESWASMERFMERVNETKYDHTANISENGNYQWADWLSYEDLESCGGRQYQDGALRPEALEYWNYLGASYWAIDAEMMRDMARATGRNAAKYERMVQEAKAYLRERFLTPDGKFRNELLNTMQTPALFALKNQLVEGKARQEMLVRLRQNFVDHGMCLQTGFLGTSILMKTLTDNGMVDVAYELLFQRKNPSWLYSIDNGATTIWERWNSYMIEHGMGPQGMNSFNHYAYGAVCQWIWQTAAGIAADPQDPGFRHIIMSPVPDRRLGHLEADYQSAAGRIRSAWKYKGNQWVWKFTIPAGSTATVTLPGQTTSREYRAGTYTVKVDNL